MARRAMAALTLAVVLAGAGCSGTGAVARDPGSGAAAPAPTVTVAPDPLPTVPPADRLAVERAVDAYLAEPVTARALALAAEIAQRGDHGHGPYLVDLLRMSGSSEVHQAVAAALSSLRDGTRPGPGTTDQPVVGDLNGVYVELGSWVLDNLGSAPGPGPRYPAFKRQLYGAVDAGFVPLLEAIEDPATLAAIQWGGVPVGGIAELNGPVRIAPDEAVWAEPDEVVYAVEVAGVVIGYPRRIIGRHELANDEALDRISGERVPFAVSYCSLCRTAVAFDRRVGDRELTFITSGLLLDANKVMVDNETGTLWQQATGLAIAGPLAGERLQLLPMRVTSFGEVAGERFVSVLDLPEPFITDRETGTLVTYPYLDVEPLSDYLAGGRLWFPVAGVEGAPDPLREVATLEIGDQALAVDLEALDPDTATVLDVGPTLILLVVGPGGPRMFDVTWVDEDDHGRIADLVRAGAPVVLEATPLPELPVGREAWFSWLARHPTTLRWPRV